jgi:Domain of unknown function (DUF4440)
MAVGATAGRATAPSSPLPPNSESAADLEAIAKAIEAVAEATARGDAAMFNRLVTEDFKAIQGGLVITKEQRIAEIQKAGPQQNQGTWIESSTRIHGDLAVTTRLSKTSRQTIIHAKQGGRWLRAAVINTPIAGG